RKRGRRLGLLSGEVQEEGLRQRARCRKKSSQNRSEWNINEGAIDQDVNIIETLAHNRDANGQRDEENEQCLRRNRDQDAENVLCQPPDIGGYQIYQNVSAKSHRHPIHHPLGLLALERTGNCAITVDLGGYDAHQKTQEDQAIKGLGPSRGSEG